MKAFLIATAALSLLALSGTAQTPAPGSFAGTRAPGLWIQREANPYKPMEIHAAAIDIKVRGHLATTTVELTFFNPNARVMEGEFVFPLDEGQTVSGYALEVEDKMRQAVIVEKQRGRAIFEEIVRRGIDPGLAELTRGNVFRTRIYPIFASSTKRVSVTFEQEFKGDGDTFRYSLPMFIPGKLKTYHTRVEVVRPPGAPFTKGGGEALEFKRPRDSQSQVAEFMREDEEMWRPIEFHVPKRDDHTQIFLVEDRAKPSRKYFHARVEPRLPQEVTPLVLTPKRVAIFYDASGSAAKRLRVRELEMLDAWLKSLGPVKVDLVVFRNEAEKLVTFDIKDGGTAALREAMEAAAFDGGTSLGAVDIRMVPEADAIVLVSDGFSTFGPDEPVVTRPDGSAPPLFAIHAAKQADAANLERLTRKTGGRVLNLMRLEVNAAVSAMRTPPVRLLQWEVISGKVEDLAIPRQEVEDGAFVIAGKVQGRSVVELSIGRISDTAVKHRLTLDPEEALEPARGAFVRRAWAQCRLAELSVDAKRHESEITALGREHRIVTPGTSLMVLERIEDYARHRLEPVEPELRAKYFALLKRHPQYNRERVEEISTRYVTHLWQGFKNWHEKRHPWLESVIKGAAEHEAAIYEALASGAAQGPGPLLKAEDALAAAALAERANLLAAQWVEASKEEDTRAAWTQEATKVLRAVRALRQQRMNLVEPHADRSAGFGSGIGGWGDINGFTLDGAGGGFGRGTGIGGSIAISRAMAINGAAFPMAGALPAEAPASRAPGDDKTTPSEEEGLLVKPWDPDTPYLTKLRKSGEPVQEYLSLRTEYAASPAFFTDCAGYFLTEKKDAAFAMRVLSNLAELDLENATLLRTLAFHLKQHGRHDLAAQVYEEVLRIRGEEPQSRRDLALCLASLEKPDYTRAVRLLWEVVTRPWDQRFYGIQLTALHELNDLIQHIPKEQMPDLKALGVDETLLANLPVALRVVLSWDTDNVDVNFYVIDPAGEVCFAGMPRTQTGGRMSAGMSRGYGPEVFMIRRPLPGKYTVLVACQGNYQQKASLPPTVQLEFQSGFNEVGAVKRELITRRLEKMYDAMEVGTFSVKLEDLAAE